MSTRSNIIVQRADGKWASQYCHFDGYLKGVGTILFEHYKDQAKIDQLSELGDLSSLGEEIGVKHNFNYRGKMCRVYGRDRGDIGTEAILGDTIQAVWPSEDDWTEFTYVWSREYGNPDGQWYVGDSDEGSQALVSLEAALKGEAAVTPKIKVPFLGSIGRHKPVG